MLLVLAQTAFAFAGAGGSSTIVTAPAGLFDGIFNVATPFAATFGSYRTEITHDAVDANAAFEQPLPTIVNSSPSLPVTTA